MRQYYASDKKKREEAKRKKKEEKRLRKLNKSQNTPQIEGIESGTNPTDPSLLPIEPKD
jgi:hypothetical protein